MKNFQSLSEIRSEIDAGRLTVKQLTEYYLENINNSNGRLNAFLSVFSDEALKQSEAVDQKLQNGTAGKLAGMVIGIKDVFCYQDHELSCSSKILQDFNSQFTATCIQRLLDEDAIIIGRQNCDEFAMGSTNENSAFKTCKNPIDETKVPGGSSGGSACAVAADFCQVSIGSDTGGSVRQPAAFCGICGLKPTYGRVSRYGLAAYASSFDTVGILSKSVEDSAIVLEVMAGHDQYDSTASTVPYQETDFDPSKKYKIGVLADSLMEEGVQEEIKDALHSFKAQMESNGHEVDEVDFGFQEYLLPTYYILTAAEASSNLSRYDGVRFGHRTESSDIHEMYKETRTDGFGTEVKRRIMMGTFVLSARYHDAYYTKAQKVRRMIKEGTEKLLEEYDFLLSPTTPTTALSIGEVTDDPIQMYLEDLFTVQANVTGIPGISIPYGEDKQGMPIGIQIMTKSFKEAELLAFSNQITTFTKLDKD